MPQKYKVIAGPKPIAPSPSEAGTGSIPASGSPPRYRRKVTIIEAEQFMGGGHPNPRGVCMKPCLDASWIHPHVHTMHNNQSVLLNVGDWVIPEPDGVHFYPCKAEVFQATYERLPGPPPWPC